MLTKEFVLDDFFISGTNEDDFAQIIRQIDDNTRNEEVVLKNYAILSLKDCQDESETPGAWYLNTEDPSNQGNLLCCTIPKSKERNKDVAELLIHELFTTNRTMLFDKERRVIFFLSNLALNTLAQRINVSGTSLREQSVERDLFIAKKMNISERATCVIRSYKGFSKIFAFLGKDYPRIKLYELCNIYIDLIGESHLGSSICEGWDITHERARIAFAFPEYAEEVNAVYCLKKKMTPCVELMTSDIGESSFIVRGYWKTETNAIVYGDTFSKQHRGNINTDTLEKDIREQIFDKYTILPERLLELMSIDITPPELDLQKSRDGNKNRKIVRACFNSVFKQLELVKVIGKKRMLSLEECIDFSVVNEEMHYTAYDIVMDIFDLSETTKAYFEKEGLSAENMRKFRETISKAAYADFNKPAEIGKVFLTQ